MRASARPIVREQPSTSKWGLIRAGIEAARGSREWMLIKHLLLALIVLVAFALYATIAEQILAIVTPPEPVRSIIKQIHWYPLIVYLLERRSR